MELLAFIADIHYYSPSLGTTGRAYELRTGSDQKCLAESGAVFDAAADFIASRQPDAVCIAGDLTNDGEKCSHEEIYERLSRLNEKTRVFPVTSTHDWCSDGHARRYEGEKVFRDVEILTGEEVARLYSVFGEKDVLASFTTAKGFASKVYKISDALRLIAVNDDCDGEGGRSGYSPAHLDWMKEQLASAKADGAAVIAMEHHLMLHGISPLINGGQSIADNFEVASVLADAGLRLIFVGHSHMQRTTEFVSDAGNKLTQVNIGSLSGHPAPVNFVKVEGRKAEVNVEFLPGFTYEGKQYGAEFFRRQTSAVLDHLLEAAVNDKEDLRARLAADGIRLKPLDAVYPFIRFAAKKTLTLTAGKFCFLVNFLTFGQGIDRKAAKSIRHERLLPHVTDIFLHVFDGSANAGKQKDEVKKIASDVGSLPGRVLKKLPIKKEKKQKMLGLTAQIEGIVNELVYPSKPDNLHFTVEL